MISRAQFMGLGVLVAMAGEGFNNPVVKNNNDLFRQAIKSPNYVTGVSGWTINKDGSAEFNNLTLRGTFFGVDYIINSAGAFFYDGVPALGNLLISIANNNGNDSFGNTYFAGVYVYSGTIAQGFAAFLAEVRDAGVTVSQWQADSITGTVFSDGHSGTTQPLILNFTHVDFSSRALINILSAIISGSSNNPLLDITNAQAAPTNSAIRVIAAAASDLVYSTRVSGDTSNRWRVDSNGKYGWGTGAGGADTVMYRSSAGVLAADNIVNNVGGSAETWHTLGALGAHYTVTLGRYRFTNEGMLFLDINVVGDGLQSTSVTFANTLPAAYRPVTTHDVLPMGTTRQVTASDIWPRLTVSSAGAVTVINQGTANTFAFCGAIPLD